MCCGSEKLSKIGEDVTETLAVIPRQWKVIQTVCEKFTCRHCEKISQPPALFHPTPRGWRECLRPVARLREREGSGIRCDRVRRRLDACEGQVGREGSERKAPAAGPALNRPSGPWR